jgi:hypothetical protein
MKSAMAKTPSKKAGGEGPEEDQGKVVRPQKSVRVMLTPQTPTEDRGREVS